MLRKEIKDHEVVEKSLINYGWRKGERQRLNISNKTMVYTNIKKYIWIEEFKKQFFKINNISDENIFRKVLEELNNKDEITVLNFFKRGIPIKDEKTKKNNIYYLFDYRNIENNSFVYFHELQHGVVRPDFTLYINGIPLIIIEVKSQEIVFDKGNDQIKRYQKEEPELFKYVQFAIVCGLRKRYIPTRPYGDQGEIIWREDDKDIIPKIIDKKLILEFVKYFIFYRTDKTKIVARYIQYYATKRILDRIREYLEGKSDKNKGLIWHWQGSGKTYTMFFTANYFYDTYKEIDPIIFFIVDRKELEDQMDKVFKDIFFDAEVIKINTINKLKEVLTKIKESQKNIRVIERGLYLLMIHKFNENLDFDDVIDKKEILFLIDEAHRTQYGELKGKLNEIFEKAMQFGFTGTPVFKREKNTFKEFSYSDELYLHVYFIKQSIKDGFTLPIKYRRIAEKDLNIVINENELKSLLGKYGENVDLDKIEKQINRKLLINSKKRIEKLAKYIYENIKEDTENYKYKAFVVVSDREACVKMKEALDKYFKEEETEIVMTYLHNDKDNILTYKKKLFEKYGTMKIGDINKKIKEKFLKGENPKILIVTDMLLTGFDCPKLKVMYLDKFLYEHRLLQAIARTNRPYKEKKFGLVVDSVGVLEYVKKIMGEYNAIIDENIKKDVVENMFTDINKEFEEFKEDLIKLKNKLKNLKIKDDNLSIDVDQIKNNLNEKQIDNLKEKLSSFAMFLKLGYERNSLKFEELFYVYSGMKKIISLYKALGSYPDKLKYKKDVEAIYLILKIINYYLNSGKKTKKELLNEIKQYFEDKLMLDLFEDLDTVFIHKETQFGKKKLSQRVVSSLKNLYFRLDRLYKFRHNPVYKELNKKFIDLIVSWSFKKYNDLQIMEQIKELNEKFQSFEKEYGSTKDSIVEIKKYLDKEYNINSKNLENIFKKVKKNKKMLPEDLKKIKTILLRELIKNQKNAKDEIHKLEEYILGRLEEDGIEIRKTS